MFIGSHAELDEESYASSAAVSHVLPLLFSR